MIRPANRIELLTLIPPGMTWCEVGVLRGEFSHEIIRHATPFHLHLVDSWCGPYPWRDQQTQAVELTYGLENLREVTTRFMGRVDVSIWRTPSAEWWQQAPALDAVYIDGAHDFASVMIDLEGALRAINKRPDRGEAYILGHDYCDGGVLSGVRRAVDQFIETHGLEMWALTSESPSPVNRVSEADQLMPAEVAYDSFAIKILRGSAPSRETVEDDAREGAKARRSESDS